MKNSKRAVKVLNSTGGTFTSTKKAIKYLKQGRARYIDDQTIEMIADDYRHLSAVRSTEQPTAHLVTSPTPMDISYEYDGPENLRTFAPYPYNAREFGRAA